MNANIEQPPRQHTREWLIALLIAFVLGFLFAWWLFHHHSFTQPLCPQPGRTADTAQNPAQKGGGAMRGGGAPGKGSPMTVNGAGKGPSDVQPGGAASPAGGGAPAGGAGNGSGKMSGGGAFDVSGKTIVNGASGAGNGAPGAPPQAGGGGSGNGDLSSPPASGSAGGNLVANIAPGTGHGNKPGDGRMDAGGGDGKTPQGDVQPTPSSPSSVTVSPAAGTQPVSKTPGGALQLGPPMDNSGLGASKPADKVVAALDYRYDKSGLPHYPNAIKVASGTDAATAAATAGPIGKDYSITEIITDDPPDVAAAWYHDHLPAGWNELQMPSAAAMDQEIAQTKAPAANNDPVGAMLNAMIVGPQLQQSKPGIDAARAAGLTIFQPADQNTDHRMILVIRDSKTGKTGILLMKKADTQ